MKTEHRKRKVDNLLTLLLFGVFAVCILAVLLTGADVYRRLSHRDQLSYNRRTAAQYLTTRVRQADRLDALSVRVFGGQDSLVFTEEIDGISYETLIYCHGGYLRELFAVSGGKYLPEDGEKILAVKALSIRQDGQLLHLELAVSSGEVQTMSLYLRSRKEAAK